MSQDKQSPPPRTGMVAAGQVLALALGELRYSVYPLMGYNILWFVVSLPVITLPPATAALYVITREISFRRSVSVADFFRAMRDYWWSGWRWGLLNALAAGIIYLNLTFYHYMDNVFSLPLITLWIGLAFVWIVVQMYCFPVLLEQAQPSLRTALRNAAVLVLRYPVLTLAYAIVPGLFIFISVLVPFLWALITSALLAFLYNRTVYFLVQIEEGNNPFLDSELFRLPS